MREIIALTVATALSIALIMLWAYAPLLWFPPASIAWAGLVWWIGTLLMNGCVAERRLRVTEATKGKAHE